MLFEQDQHRSLIEAIVQRNSARAEALAQEHARFNQRFLALWEKGVPITRRSAERVSVS